MTAQESIHRHYAVTTREGGDTGVYRVSYTPRGLQQAAPSRRPKKLPEHIATVNVLDESVSWDKPPADAEVTVEEFGADALRRAKVIHGWLALLTPMLGSVWEWANDPGWSGTRIGKRMDDSE